MRIEQLTFTRFIAAIAVVFFHHYPTLDFFKNANVFVGYFFILSGFVMIISQKQSFLTTQEFSRFYINRLARIYPVYLLSNLVYAAILHLMGWNFLLNVIGIQSFLPDRALSYNYPGWSVSVEFFFYGCFPFLMRYFFKRYTWKTVLVASLAFWLLSQTLFHALHFHTSFTQTKEGISFLLYNPLNHLNAFILGCVAGLLFKKSYAQWRANYDGVIVLLSAAIVCYVSYIKTPLNLFDHNGLLMVLFIPFILLLALNTGFITRLFKQRLLVVGGEISFCLYILAEPVFMGLRRLSKIYSTPALAEFYFSLAVLIGVSCLVHFLLEKPLQQWIKQKADRLFGSQPDRNKVHLPASTPTRNILVPAE